jgi:hypothetical protein
VRPPYDAYSVPRATVGEAVKTLSDVLDGCASTPDHLPALLSRFLLRYMRIRIPEIAQPSNWVNSGADPFDPMGNDVDFSWTASDGLEGSPRATLASLLDDQNNLIPGLDAWLDLSVFLPT